MLAPILVTARNIPGPVTLQASFVEGQSEGTPELIVGECAVALVIPAGVEPPAVLRVDKESFTGTDIFISWYGEYFG